MIYALACIVLACFLVTIALIAYVWTLKQAAEIDRRELDRRDALFNATLIDLQTKIVSISDRLQKFEVRPEAPAVEQYRKVLGEIEEFGHTVRTLENRMVETIESVRRTQNKLAARSKRTAEPEIDAQIEAITAQGDVHIPLDLSGPARRRFGQVRT